MNNRRLFLGAAGALALTRRLSAAPSDTVRVGIIGVGGEDEEEA